MNLEQKRAVSWVRRNVQNAQKANMTQTSYHLKHILEAATGIYMTNEDFKDLMLKCGFVPVDETALNTSYRIKRVHDLRCDDDYMRLRSCADIYHEIRGGDDL